MPSTHPAHARFAPMGRRLGEDIYSFIALPFPCLPVPASLRPFVVISRVAEGAAGIPLCFEGSLPGRH